MTDRFLVEFGGRMIEKKITLNRNLLFKKTYFCRTNRIYFCCYHGYFIYNPDCHDANNTELEYMSFIRRYS